MSHFVLKDVSSQNFIFEQKFAVPVFLRHRIISILKRHTIIPEKFAFAKMKTTYFDDSQNNSYFDSRDGYVFRKKFRFREYLNADSNSASYSIETKIRKAEKTSKVKYFVYNKLPQTYKLTTFDNLMDYIEKNSDLSLNKLRQQANASELSIDTVIFYERFRFDSKHNNARFNLDTNITVTPSLKSENSHKGLNLAFDIFEIKNANFVESCYFLQELKLEPLSISKFVWGKEVLI